MTKKMVKSQSSKTRKNYVLTSFFIIFLVSLVLFGIVKEGKPSMPLSLGDGGTDPLEIWVDANWTEDNGLLEEFNQKHNKSLKWNKNATNNIHDAVENLLPKLSNQSDDRSPTIYVRYGFYKEGNGITLDYEGCMLIGVINYTSDGKPRRPTIGTQPKPNLETNTIKIANDHITIANFIIVESGKDTKSDDAGIKLKNANYTTISNCIINGCYDGIHLDNGMQHNGTGHTPSYSHDNKIINCIIADCHDEGIYLHASYNNSIINCTVTNSKESGIFLFGGRPNVKNISNLFFWVDGIGPVGKHNTIKNCTVYGNGIHGIKLWLAWNNTIENCYVYDNGNKEFSSGGDEISLENFSNNNHIFNCTILPNDNGHGIQFSVNCMGNWVINNTIKVNDAKYTHKLINIPINVVNLPILPIIPVPGISVYNIIFLNNLIQKKIGCIQVSDQCGFFGKVRNFWDSDDMFNLFKHKLQRGNYWSGLKGTDDDSNYLYDDPYPIPGPMFSGLRLIDVQDRYPLVLPIGKIDVLPPKIHIKYPNNGEYIRDKVDITWFADDENKSFFLQIFKIEPDGPFIQANVEDHSKPWELMIDIYYENETGEGKIASIENKDMNRVTKENSYTWDTSNFSDGIYRIKLIATDKGKNSNWDISSGVFLINNEEGPFVSKVIITDTNLTSTGYVKDGHTVEVMANIKSKVDIHDLDISADLREIKKDSNGSEPPTSILSETTAIWIVEDAICNPSNGSINVTVTVIDPQKRVGKNIGTIIADNEPPSIVRITKPARGYLYVADEGIYLFLPPKPLIVGPISINVEALDTISGINKVELYANNYYLGVTNEYPFIFSSQSLGRMGLCTIRVRAFDETGNYAEDELQARVLF